MEFVRKENGNEGAFIAMDGDRRAGLMTYSVASPELIIVDHTEVENAYRGRNVGLRLVNAAVAYARENNIKIMPLCPFVKSVFKKREDISDVLK